MEKRINSTAQLDSEVICRKEDLKCRHMNAVMATGIET